MTTVLVQFKPLPTRRRAQAIEMFRESAPRFQKLDGLVRKYYLFQEDGTCGGVYLWDSREKAERFFTESWKDEMEKRFGGRPSVTYFDSPVIVDNVAGEITVKE